MLRKISFKADFSFNPKVAFPKLKFWKSLFEHFLKVTDTFEKVTDTFGKVTDTFSTCQILGNIL
jgi:hypothetical protein